MQNNKTAAFLAYNYDKYDTSKYKPDEIRVI